jgi:hypothetical protein
MGLGSVDWREEKEDWEGDLEIVKATSLGLA